MQFQPGSESLITTLNLTLPSYKNTCTCRFLQTGKVILSWMNTFSRESVLTKLFFPPMSVGVSSSRKEFRQLERRK